MGSWDQQAAGDFGGVVLAGADGDLEALHAKEFGLAVEVGEVGLALEVDGDGLVGGVALDEASEGAVVEQLALIDDDDAAGQGLDVGHVVAGEEDGGAGFGVVGGDEFADALLHGDVEADGGLVQEEHAGGVQQAGGKFDFHALAEG